MSKAMKLYASDNSELMEVSQIRAEKGQLYVDGLIMGAMPIRAVVKPAEMRRALLLMNIATLFRAALMLIKPSR